MAKELTNAIKISTTISPEAMKILYKRKDSFGSPLSASIDKAIRMAEKAKWREK